MIYRRLLGSDFDRLPRALRDFHDTPGGGRAAGTITVRHQNRWLARLVGFPRPCTDQPLELEVRADENREVWIRRFGDGVRESIQWQHGDLLAEAAGPVRMFFRVLGDGTGMRFELVRARLWGLPLPLRVNTWVRGAESSWEFEVVLAHVGSYRGVMVPGR